MEIMIMDSIVDYLYFENLLSKGSIQFDKINSERIP